MPADLAQFIDRFHLNVLVLGGFALDRHAYGNAEDISPEAPVPVLRLNQEIERPGDAGHVAAALTALGANVTCSGALGEDPAGRSLVDLLTQAGINTSGIELIPHRQTTTHARLIGLAQLRHPQQMMRVEQASPDPLPAHAVDRLASTVRAAAGDARAVCVRDSEAGDWPETLCRAAIDAARHAGRPVLVSPVADTDWQRYRGATVLTPNRRKLALQLRESPSEIARIGALAQPLVQELELQAMVVTLDRDGALVVPANADPTHVPTRPRAVYDITGAGDVTLAMLTLAVAAGADWTQAARLANVAAGLSVERFGPVTITADEMRADLSIEGRAGAGKLRGLDDLTAELAPRRSAGAKVVFTNGCFDILHAGHIQYFKFCRQHGDIVVVGLNSDASVHAQGKGDDRPINNQLNRARMLSALEDVDYVVIFEDPTPEKVIRRILPDVLVKGADWAKWVCGREVVEAAGGKVVLAPMLEGYSTSQLLAQIRGMEQRRERDD
ncbi:MAG: bifunctional heptose 7-phosphate kinase/heptose 1-phosphate adenyltransferase [Phycisphaerae bacterium]|nr:bifunctional heptose 7-phosphate kinase/heptose 1-phosphate adenyltransferase [Phycisphaerae bacterium]